MKPILLVLTLLPWALGAGCGTVATPGSAMFDSGSQVQSRSFQTRAFDTTDRERTLRAMLTTLQDLGFIIERADATLGIVNATKISDYRIQATVSVRPRNMQQVLVRANAQYSFLRGGVPTAISDPTAYQDFFTALSRTMFLDAVALD